MLALRRLSIGSADSSGMHSKLTESLAFDVTIVIELHFIKFIEAENRIFASVSVEPIAIGISFRTNNATFRAAR